MIDCAKDFGVRLEKKLWFCWLRPKNSVWMFVWYMIVSFESENSV